MFKILALVKDILDLIKMILTKVSNLARRKRIEDATKSDNQIEMEDILSHDGGSPTTRSYLGMFERKTTKKD